MISQKIKDMYTVYVKDLPYVKSNVEIVIYPEPHNINKKQIYKMKFCPLRKIYTFDFPKSIFKSQNKITKSLSLSSPSSHSNAKILRFNFIINGKLLIAPHYQLINIDNHYINQIDFVEIDEKIKNNNKIIDKYLYKSKSKCDYEIKYIQNINNKHNKCSNLFHELSYDDDSEREDDEYGGLRLGSKANNNNTIISKVSRECFNNGIDTKRIRKLFTTDSIMFNNDTHLKSILKCTMKMNCIERRAKERRVSFGTVQFSY
jgi:hypothetical protein